MRIFTKTELLGEWNNEAWRFQLYENNSLLIKWKNGNEVHGSFKIFENFLILNYVIEFTPLQWTSRIENLNKNVLILTDLSNDVGQKEEMHKSYFDINLIKKFDFNEQHYLSLQELKDLFGIEKLQLNTLKDSQGKPTSLYRHWENNSRFAINFEKELVEQIKLFPDIRFSLYKEIKISKLGYFTNFTITEYIENNEDIFDNFDEYDGRYNRYNGAYGYDDNTIDSAFDGDPENYWNID